MFSEIRWYQARPFIDEDDEDGYDEVPGPRAPVRCSEAGSRPRG